MGCHALLQGVFLTQGSNLRALLAGRFFTTEPAGKPVLHVHKDEEVRKCATDRIPKECKTLVICDAKIFTINNEE